MLLASLASGCLTSDVGDFTDESPDVEVGTSAACVLPPTPPPYDELWFLPHNGHPYRYEWRDNYGTSECSSIVVAVRGADIVSAVAKHAHTQAECVETSITWRFYRKRDGAWSYVSGGTEAGVWHSTGSCNTPGAAILTGVNQEMRIYAKSKRTTCSGMFCGTTYGLPVNIQTDSGL